MNFSRQEIFKKIKSFYKNPTAINIITVGLIALLVKGFGFYKEMIVAETFGLSELLDTFFIALLVPGFVYNVFLRAFSTVFIPNYVAEIKSGNNVASFQCLSIVITIISALVFIGLSFIFFDGFLELLFPNHEASYYKLIRLQFYYLVPSILFWGLSALLSGLLNVYDEFKYSSIYPIFTSVIMIVCLVFFKDELQEKVLAFGMFLGSIVEFIFLLTVSVFKKIIVLNKPDFSSHNAKVMIKQVPAKVSSGFLTGLIPVTDQYFAAQLAVGSIAALNYGLKVPAFFTTITIMAFGNVLLPYFSKLTIDNAKDSFNQLFRLIKWVLISVLILMIILSVFSEYIISLLFERNNFTQADTNIVYRIQIIFLLGVPFAICGNLFVKFLTSINKNAFMAYVSLGSMLLNIVLDIILMKYYGVFGIAICTTVIHIIKIGVFYTYTHKQKKIMVASS